MTLLEILERPDPAPVSRKRTRTERTRAELVADYFKAHPNEWIDGLVFRGFAGGYGGWSARIREVKKRYGMQIENRQVRRRDGSVLSEYRFVVGEDE